MSVKIVSRTLPRPRRGAGGGLWLTALSLLALGLWLQGRPEFVAWQLGRDHRRAFADRPGERVWSSEPGVVAAWLERHGTPVPPLPAHAGGSALVGARYCALVDRVAAHVLYEGDEDSLSLFVLPGPLRAPREWAARLGDLYLRRVGAAGRTLLIVGESEADVLALERAFTTTVATRDAVDRPLSNW